MDYLKKFETQISEMFSSETSGHDINHLKRVLNIAQHIQKQEGGNELVINASALLHDVHRLIEKETGKPCHPKESLPTVKKILEDVHFPKDKIKHVLQCVEFHEEYTFSEGGITVTDIESLILQDADNLDSIGAIGIARVFTFSGAYGYPMWDPSIPLENKFYDSMQHDPSSIHHFHSKLLKIKDGMNTKTGKKIAAHRHKYMENFLKEFFKEWEGKS